MFNPYADKWQAEVNRAINDTKNCKKQYWIHDQLQKAKRDEAEENIRCRRKIKWNFQSEVPRKIV